MKKVLSLMLTLVLGASLFALAGCGGAANNDKNFIGTWELTGMSENGEEMLQENLELLKSLGLTVELIINEDGTCSLVLFGEAQDGTWESVSASVCALTFGGETIEATLSGKELKLEQSNMAMTFEKAS